MSVAYLDKLNAGQRRAVEHGVSPLLIIAGAGTVKTNTLAHRVAHLIVNGADPRRILLMTFSRRASGEMTRRVERIARQVKGDRAGVATDALIWTGTFHGIGARLLRVYADQIGLDPAFTIHDREDSADLMNFTRHELGFSKTESRFPAKGTCLAIYSRCINVELPIEDVLRVSFPWCSAWAAELKQLFASYVEAKQRQNVLDYDVRSRSAGWPAELERARLWYEPHLERIHEDAVIRRADLIQLEQIATGYASRERFLTELTLDLPDATSDQASAPLLDEDYLILSTIHSAKGQEWKSVFVLNAVDGCIPSDLAVGTLAEVEEERRLLYVAMTRAKNDLHLVVPQRFFTHGQRAEGDRHIYASRTRFIPDELLSLFDRSAWPVLAVAATAVQSGGDGKHIDVRARLRGMWQ